jgi:hypothetical protein
MYRCQERQLQIDFIELKEGLSYPRRCMPDFISIGTQLCLKEISFFGKTPS